MKIRKLEVADTRREIICKSFLITEIDAFEQLIDIYDEYALKFPEAALLVSLDNLGQALYTSMHATLTHDLHDIEGHDLTNVEPAAFEDGDHIGYLTTESEFFIVEENFKTKAKDVSFLDACAKGLGLDNDEIDSLEKLHRTPASVLDEQVTLWVVPVSDPSLALCACPNGYFSCDLNPFETYALAKHLNDSYGYHLFGIGASCMGFRRKTPLSRDLAAALGRDITRLYNCQDDDEKFERILHIVENHDYLFLKYVEELSL